MRVKKSFQFASVCFMGASLFAAAFAHAGSDLGRATADLVLEPETQSEPERARVRVDFTNVADPQRAFISCKARLSVTQEERVGSQWKQMVRNSDVLVQSRVIAPGKQTREIQFAFELARGYKNERRNAKAELKQLRCDMLLPEAAAKPQAALEPLVLPKPGKVEVTGGKFKMAGSGAGASVTAIMPDTGLIDRLVQAAK